MAGDRLSVDRLQLIDDGPGRKSGAGLPCDRRSVPRPTKHLLQAICQRVDVPHRDDHAVAVVDELLRTAGGRRHDWYACCQCFGTDHPKGLVVRGQGEGVGTSEFFRDALARLGTQQNDIRVIGSDGLQRPPLWSVPDDAQLNSGHLLDGMGQLDHSLGRVEDGDADHHRSLMTTGRTVKEIDVDDVGNHRRGDPMPCQPRTKPLGDTDDRVGPVSGNRDVLGQAPIRIRQVGVMLGPHQWLRTLSTGRSGRESRKMSMDDVGGSPLGGHGPVESSRSPGVNTMISLRGNGAQRGVQPHDGDAVTSLVRVLDSCPESAPMASRTRVQDGQYDFMGLLA